MNAIEKRLAWTALGLLLILSSGCAGQTPTAAPTAVSSPAPTDTSAPTDTPTPLPTATFTPTPDAMATQSAEATAQAKAREAELKAELDDLGIPTDTGSLGWYQEKPAELKTDGGGQELVGLLDNDYVAGDFAVAADITWETTGIITCGLVLRSKENVENDAHYMFEMLRLSGLPGWSISYYDNGAFQYMLSGQPYFAGAIDGDNGATNRVVITAIDNEFNVYINGVRQTRLFDDSKRLSEGRFGNYLWQESGHTTCTVDHTAVWVYK